MVYSVLHETKGNLGSYSEITMTLVRSSKKPTMDEVKFLLARLYGDDVNETTITIADKPDISNHTGAIHHLD